MKTIPNIRSSVLILLVLTNLTAVLAHEVSVPDPGLNAAIRETLNKPVGLLTEQDLFGLTNLNASGRNISNLQGLDAAHNLSTLDLQSNQLANLTFSGGRTNLNFLDLSFNPLTNCTISSGLTYLTALIVYTILGSMDLNAWSELTA